MIIGGQRNGGGRCPAVSQRLPHDGDAAGDFQLDLAGAEDEETVVAA